MRKSELVHLIALIDTSVRVYCNDFANKYTLRNGISWNLVYFKLYQQFPVASYRFFIFVTAGAAFGAHLKHTAAPNRGDE